MKRCKYPFIVFVIAMLSGVSAYAATGDASAITGLATTGYVDGAIGSLTATNNVTTGNYITAVKESGGKVSITQTAMDTAPTLNSKKPVTSGGVYAALDGKLAKDGTATKATADALGNNIVNTYATKAERVQEGNAEGKFTEAQLTDKTAYPSMNAAAQIATQIAQAKLTEVNINGLTASVATLEENMDKLNENIEEGLDKRQLKSTANYQVGNSSGGWTAITTAVVGTNSDTTASTANQAVAVTNSGGKAQVSVRTGTPSQYGVVKVGEIPSGSATSTTYAQIWVQ